MVHLTPEELKRFGKTLFGEHWQADLTAALDLGDSSRLRAMLAGRRPIPMNLSERLRTLVLLRRDALEDLIKSIDAAPDR
ncbi:hypothetical protein EJV46_21840 [Roseococcus sp. SYP-B2431]|uniref:hypothetical protein n=1 Tax=Roseococcus sp. SYP-B2431 TaxID=2496640 RepID=UPI00103ED097|nr:hypothetical protein [Roseococcus sp. SYP-B2431]TCH96221.1 hypothetical protein EJV46_21840 [Roseococcus sp. SYP-B2431]